MRRSIVLYISVGAAILGLGALSADALVTTDEERLEQLADDLTERAPGERVGAVLAWTDLSRAEVELTSGDDRAVYGDGSGDAALADDLTDALAPFTASELDVVQRSVRVDGDRATVSVRARTDGLHDATFHLARSGQGWVVERIHAR